jgi:hypothetical protein
MRRSPVSGSVVQAATDTSDSADTAATSFDESFMLFPFPRSMSVNPTQAIIVPAALNAR